MSATTSMFHALRSSALLLMLLSAFGAAAHAQVTSLSAAPSSMRLFVTWRWHETKLTAQTPGGPVIVPRTSATWSSSNPAVVTVNAQGIITAVGTGTANISATYGGQTAVQAVTVVAPVLPPAHETPDPYLTTPATGWRDEMPVLIMRFLPTLNGVDLDVNNVPDFGSLSPSTLAAFKSTLNTHDKRIKFMLEEGSKFRGYSQPSATPMLGYRVVDLITVYEPTPPGPQLSGYLDRAKYAVDYQVIASRFNWQYYIDTLGVKEIWLWFGCPDPGIPSYNPATMDSLNFRTYEESNMSSPTTGDISNSPRIAADLPIYTRTYTVYSYNARRSHNEAVHNHMHQLESIFTHVCAIRDGNINLFWQHFVGRDANNNHITGRCGWSHMPPNTTAHYDLENTTQVLSDIEDWKPDNSGTKKLVSKFTWENLVYSWPTPVIPGKVEAQWYIYWMQSIPGCGNTIPYGSRFISNWWKMVSDWDQVITSGYGLHMAAPTPCPSPIPMKVTLLQPAHQSTLPGVAPVFRWRKAPLAQTYRFQLATDTLFGTTSLLSDQDNLADTLVSVPVSCGMQLYWRVQGVNSTGPGPWSDVWTVTTPAPPTVSLAAPERVCAGDSARVTFTFTGAPPFRVEYTLGTSNLVHDTSASPVLTVTLAPRTTLEVRVTAVTDANCAVVTLPDPDTIRVDELPSARIFAPSALCAGDTLQIRLELTGTPPFDLRYLLNGVPTAVNGHPSSEYFLTLVPQGLTRLRMQSVRDARCVFPGGDSVLVAWHPLPRNSITASGPLRFCDGDSVILRADGAGSCLWSTGETTDSIVVHRSGTYTVTVTSAEQCVSRSAPVTVTVFSRPAPVITPSKAPTLCAGDSVTLDAGAGYASYRWSTGSETRTITVRASGDYGVTVVNAEGCAASAQPLRVRVDSIVVPVIQPAGSATLCDGDSVVLDAGAGFAEYRWSTGARTRMITVRTSGAYHVEGLMDGGCGGMSQPVLITVNPVPPLPTSADVQRCGQGSVTLTAGNTMQDVTFRWYTSVAATTWLKETTGEFTTPVLVITTPYYVSAVLPSGCESERVRVQAVIAPTPEPVISVTGPVELRVRDSVVLSAPDGYVSYRWSTGAMSRSIVVRYAGTYAVTVTDSAGCSGTSPAVTITERVQPGVPRVSVSGPTEFCAGDSVLLSVTPGAAYEWSRDGVPVGTARHLTASATGAYWCRVQDTLSAEWRSSDTVQVLVHAPLQPEVRVLSRDTLLCENGAAWQWYLGGSPIPGATSRMWIAARDGWYSVEVTDSNGCTARSSEINITLVGVVMADAAGTIVLGAGYPNPFTSVTQIPLQLDRTRMVRIDICDQRGAIVRSIVSGALPAGRHVYAWDGRDGRGQALSSGRYYIQLTSGGTLLRKPVMLLR